jgi:hydroxypyruvate reductase
MSKTEYREAALDIFRAGLGAADPYRILRDSSQIEANKWHCKIPGAAISMDLPEPGGAGRIFAVGAGKAAASLARALEESLGDRLASGRIVVKHGHGLPMNRIIVEEGGHPLPDEGGLEGTKRLLGDLGETRPEDRVFFLLTGGGSALLVAPAEGLSLEDKIDTTRLLLGCGATIQEMNTLRKHLSAVKGGRLLERIAPALSVTLIISDVVGDDLASIGSGPTAPDPTTFEDCLEILNRYELMDKVPEKVRIRLSEGVEGRIKETPKSADGLFEEAQHLILASNRLSVDAAQQRAGELGFDVEVFAHEMEGSTHERARGFMQRMAQRSGRPLVLLAGGETTLKVEGTGKGGRNQEFALVAAREIEGQEDLMVLSAGTDGTDGPTDAAGAYADGSTYARARAQGLDPQSYLSNNDSYTLFDSLGDLLKTGPTGTNVMDLVVGIVGPRR